MYQQVLDPVAHSLAWSSLVAAIPLLLLFVMLGVLRVTAWVASLVSLAVAILVAVLVYGMPIGQTLLAGTEGAAFGFFPILWIVINAIWVYQQTVETGHFDVLRRSFSRVSDDQRIQAVLIAFSFGALLEALAGFGTPVAVTSVMLMALGFKPMKAAVLALVANTAPVAFGAMATPILTLAKVTELPSDTLGAMVGRQTPILAVFVPLVLVAIVDGWRGIRETWPAAVVCGLVFGVAQYATSNFISVPLADVVASLLSAAAVVAAGARLAPQPHVHRTRRGGGRCGRRADPRIRPTRRASRLAGRRRQGLCALRDHHRGVRRLPDHGRQEASRQGDRQVPVARAGHREPQGKAGVAHRVHPEPAHHAGHPDADCGRPDGDRAQAVGAAGGEGVRDDAASAALGDPHGDGGAGAGVRDEPVRTDDHAGHLDGSGRRSVRPAVAHPGLARRRGHRIRHLSRTRCSARCRSPRRTRPGCPTS